MRRLTVLATLVLAACSSESSSTSKTSHVLVFGIDGVRPDALEVAETPVLDALVAEGTVTYDAFAGGGLGEPTEQGTWSGPGWSSILTGVWIDKHGVSFNDFEGQRFDEYPHFYARVREQAPDAYLSSFVTWTPIHDEILASAEADEAFSPEPQDSSSADREVVAAVVEHLGEETPDVVFVALDEVDHQGHAIGFSPSVPEYVSAIEVVDGQLGEILAALRARPTYVSEDWLVVVTTDHGGEGRLHGAQRPEERTIFLIVAGGVAEAGRVVSPGPGHTAIPPTVLQHLGLELDAAWGWEDEPFGL
jgi:hypothetical protein